MLACMADWVCFYEGYISDGPCLIINTITRTEHIDHCDSPRASQVQCWSTSADPKVHLYFYYYFLHNHWETMCLNTMCVRGKSVFDEPSPAKPHVHQKASDSQSIQSSRDRKPQATVVWDGTGPSKPRSQKEATRPRSSLTPEGSTSRAKRTSRSNCMLNMALFGGAGSLLTSSSAHCGAIGCCEGGGASGCGGGGGGC